MPPDALPEIVDAVAGQCAVVLDGGVRHGADIAKTLCLGADAVMVGRPALWELVHSGAEGVADVLRLLMGEFEEVMALMGRPPWPPSSGPGVVLPGGPTSPPDAARPPGRPKAPSACTAWYAAGAQGALSYGRWERGVSRAARSAAW
ncbi:alpha-hydroxy-acid oxidizing protein [Streptomyces sp. NPDC004232]|uniref:alpha-hydroxy-acid oxidizing protein n=1 Tax=Streptomyces sp. NPDC004232 TaxID=3154454 RepID=UPI001DE10CFC|nr:alpha-hydroxy-acid oxidizing protein [Streptomyces sp. tea 10]